MTTRASEAVRNSTWAEVFFFFSFSFCVCIFFLCGSSVVTCLLLSCLVSAARVVLPCLVLPCLVLSCFALPGLVLSCLVLSCLVLSCRLALSYLHWFLDLTWGSGSGSKTNYMVVDHIEQNLQHFGGWKR